TVLNTCCVRVREAARDGYCMPISYLIPPRLGGLAKVTITTTVVGLAVLDSAPQCSVICTARTPPNSLASVPAFIQCPFSHIVASVSADRLSVRSSVDELS